MFEQSERRRQQLHELRRDAHPVRSPGRVRRAARRPGHVHPRVPRAHLVAARDTWPSRCAPTASSGRWPRWCTPPPTASEPAPAGQPVLPFAVALGDLVDGIVGFLEAPASGETLAALDRADPDDLDRTGSHDDSRRPPRVDRSARSRRSRRGSPRRGYPDDVWTQLRAEAPVAWFEPEGYEPFWAITKHADILDVASQPVRFSNEHGLILGPKGAPGAADRDGRHPRPAPARTVAPRGDASAHSPRHPIARNDDIEQLALEVLDGITAVANDGEEFDFVEHVAAPLPIAVIAWFLGVPRADRRAALPLDQRGDRQGRPRVPPARARPRARPSGGPAWRCTPTSASSSSSAGVNRPTTSSASSSRRRSTGSRSPRCSSSRTAS